VETLLIVVSRRVFDVCAHFTRHLHYGCSDGLWGRSGQSWAFPGVSGL